MQAVTRVPNDAVGAEEDALILSVTGENGWGTEYRLIVEATVIIGSASQCGLSLAGEDVSALHCSLRWDENGIWLEDWGSRNGTFLDGEKVTSEVPVELASTICVGAYTIRIQNTTSATRDVVRQSPPAKRVVLGGLSLGFDEPQVAAVTSKPANSSDFAVSTEVSQLATPTNRPPFSEDFAPNTSNLARTSTSPVVHDRDPAEVQRDTGNQETFDLLRAEVEQLQFAVAERDAQLAEALAAKQEPESAVDGASVKQLMDRLEALLDELDRSDERMGTLEELLRVTEEANRDEREERRQMESWLGDIESVFGEHQATWDAEMSELRNRTAAIAAERDQLLQQLTQPTADDHVEQDAEETSKLRLQVKHQQQRLDEATAIETRQQDELRRLQTQLAEATKAENRLREDHLKLAAERASLSRLRAEITATQAESEQSLPDAQTDTDIDTRVRGFREHLREIHDEENQEDNAPSLPGRISRLWKRLEAHR